MVPETLTRVDPATVPIPVVTLHDVRPRSTRAWRISVALCVTLVALTAAAIAGLWWYRTHEVAGAPTPATVVGPVAAPPVSSRAAAPSAARRTASTARPSASPPHVAPALAGAWQAHGIAVDVDGSGHGVMSFRTYTPCDLPSPGVPCEPVGTASDAGHATVRFESASSGSQRMRVLTSNDQPDWPVGKTSPVQQVRHGVLKIGTGEQAWGLCLPPASDPSCGA